MPFLDKLSLFSESVTRREGNISQQVLWYESYTNNRDFEQLQAATEAGV